MIGGASCLQHLIFTWLNPLLQKGAKKKAELDQLPQLPQKETTSEKFDRFYSIWQSSSPSKIEGLMLIKTLFRTFLGDWVILFFILIVKEILFVSGPILTALNIDYISEDQQNIGYGIFLFCLTFFTTILAQMVSAHMDYRFSNMGINLANTVTMMIFNKSLRYAGQAGKQFSEAEIINYSQVDAEKLTYIGRHLSAFFYGPFQFVIGLVMMYWVLGISFLTGIVIMAIMLVISYCLSKRSQQLNEQILSVKDDRMKVTQQMLDIIRYIKISAIENFFFRKISEKRVKQIKLYLKVGMNYIYTIILFWLTNPLLLAMTFLTFILLGNEMTSRIAFTAMTIVSLFQYPLYSLPTAITEVVQIFTSLKRIEKFLLVQEIKGRASNEEAEVGMAIEIENGNFYWRREQEKKDEKDKQGKLKHDKQSLSSEQGNKQKQRMNETEVEQSDDEEEDDKKFRQRDEEGKLLYVHALRDINTKIKKGGFTMIVGDIGSGKSSLLLAIINEMLATESSRVKISGQIAYSSQKPWIMSKTLKQNITFMPGENEARLRQVVYYSCLEDDLKMLPKGLQTEIGEKGINLSGGQKARVSLARALYSGKDILLLDDILSAVDVHVGEFLVQNTVKGFLAGKTIIMPTHAIKFASYADEMIVMKKGRIVRKGCFKDICDTPEFMQISVKEHQKKEKDHSAQDKQKQEEEKLQAELIMLKEAIKLKSSSQKVQKETAEVSSSQLIQQLMLPEDNESGSINKVVLKSYLKQNRGLTTLVVIGALTMLIWMALKTVASIMIKIWCDDPSRDQIYLYLFMGVSLFAIIITFIRAYVLLIAGINQSKYVHDKMIKSLLYADLSNFFNRVPIGRIVNRLTKDLRELDEVVMDSLFFVLITVIELMGTLFICLYAGTVFALIPMIVVGVLTNEVRKYYLKTTREVSRYQKTTNSPVVSGFLSTISGLSTIRAFGRQDDFTKAQLSYFDSNKRVRLTASGLESWFALVLSFLSFFINMPCIAYCMFSQGTDPSAMGLLMVYCLGVSEGIVALTWAQAGFTNQLVAIERIYKFMRIEPEKRYSGYSQDQLMEKAERAFENGQIEFQRLRVRYRRDLPEVIKGVTCVINPGQKVGIVGRTGAGKTTLVNTLLGITQITSGTIKIDGASIVDFPIKALRQSVTMIDQEPTLIKSTFRENLDLTNSYSDQELERILKECNLFDIIQEKGGLEAIVSNTSLSAGEKQLLCICRAFLKHSKIVLIDQATANIDGKNDALIQKVISEKFKESTVLTIAHRLSTLKNADKIMVMNEGELIEFGRPSDLQKKQGGFFSEMMKKHWKEMLS